MPVLLRHPRGDGTRYARELNAFLVGQTIRRVEPEVARAEGDAGDLSVVRVHFESGDRLLVCPQRVEPAVRALTGLDLAIRFVFHPARPPRGDRRILVPGVDV